jgi:peptide/nickel transport system substrate-binding protein
LRSFLALILIAIFAFSFSCRRTSSDFVTVALPENFTTFDTLTTTQSDSAAERVRNLIFNTLVRKSESFDYVGELAKEIRTSDDGKTVTFVLQDNVKFQNGKDLTSADVKYTFDEMFKANGYKSGAFFDTEVSSAPGNSNANSASTDKTRRVPHITSLETPDRKTVIITVARPALRNQLLSNLVAIPIIAEGTVAQQKDQPMGTGPFKFVRFDPSQNIVEFESNPNYWEGAPKVSKLRLKTVQDANSLQAELQTGGVDIAPLPSNLPPDAIRSLGNSPTLKVEQSNGSNLQYLVFNTQSPPLNDAKIRQAIGFAIDREKIIKELLFDQGRIANSILPPESWAYAQGTDYHYDPAKAKQLLSESGYKGEPIKFNYGSTNAAVNQYSQVIQSSLNDIGLTVQIETMDVNVLRKQLATGQFQMYTGIWIGGNQDPIFLRDLFASSRIPGENVNCCNRSRYKNPELDKLVEDAINATDRNQAKELYGKAQEIVSRDVPLFPLWYPANIVIANRRIGNIKVGPSGDWGFLKDITVQ